MSAEETGLSTRLVHGGGSHPLGAVTSPVFDTAAFAFADHTEHGRATGAPHRVPYYTRVQNPTVAALERRLALLERSPGALAFTSGMSAISTTLLTLVRGGGHVVASDRLFVTTRELIEYDLPAFGARVDFADFTDLTAVEAAIRPDTRVVYFEEFTNPALDVLDLPALVDIAHRNGALAVVDNTFATPVLLRPLEFGADLVLHSATKYLAGHGRVLAGVLAGPEELVWPVQEQRRRLGTIITPHNAAAVLEGLPTLELRMRRASATAQRLAELAAGHDAVRRVHYPGLPGPSRDLARRLTGGDAFGGMLALVLRAPERKAAVYDAFDLVTRATSLGDVRTLVDWIDDPDVLRISVGIEDPDDLAADLEKALNAAL